MGTPKKNSRKKKVSLTPPNMAEKIRLLELGKTTGENLNIQDLEYVLEEAKVLLLPLVEWLDKPLPGGKKRAMILLKDYYSLDIALERSGMWLICLRKPGLPKVYQQKNSAQLAEIMIKRVDELLKSTLDKNFLAFVQEIIPLKNISRYNTAVLHILSLFAETITKQLDEREKRILIMKERINFLKDFTQALDPITNGSIEVSLKGFSIFEESEHRSSRCTGDYFCGEALAPFWEIVAKRTNKSDFEKRISEYPIGSLSHLLRRISYSVQEIANAESRGHNNAKELFCFSSGRLPLTRKEIKVLEKIATSIAK